MNGMIILGLIQTKVRSCDDVMDAIKSNLVPTLDIDSYGTKRYLFPDAKTLHREDGPAVEYSNGHKEWHLNGNLHREDGPAIEYSYGAKEWFYYGKQIHCSSQEEFEKMLKLRALW